MQVQKEATEAVEEIAHVVLAQAMAFVIELPALLLLLVAVVLAVAFACGGQWQSIVGSRKKISSGTTRSAEDHCHRGNAVRRRARLLDRRRVGALRRSATFRGHRIRRRGRRLAHGCWLSSVRRSRVRADLLAYSQLMVTREWPLMRSGRFDPQGDSLVMDAIGAAGTYKPADMGESNAQSETMTQLGTMYDMRQRRLAESTSDLGAFAWFVLVFGAACITCFCWLFGAKNRRVHLLMTACVAVMVTSVLVLLFELQYPFRTGLRIAPDDWTSTILHIRAMQSAGNRRCECSDRDSPAPRSASSGTPRGVGCDCGCARPQRRSVDPALRAAKHLRLPFDLYERLRVAAVDPGTSAARAGIAVGDHLDFTKSNLHDRIVGISHRPALPGEAVTFSVVHEGRARPLTLRAGLLTVSESRRAIFSPLASFLRLTGFAYIAVALINLFRRPSRMTWGLFLYLVSATSVALYRFPDTRSSRSRVRLRRSRRRGPDRSHRFRRAFSRR